MLRSRFPAPPPLLLLVGVVALGLLAGFEREAGRDFHWHVVLGEQTLHAGGPVRTEQFSYTNAGGAVFVSAWLADVTLALAYRVGGYAACQLLRGVCIAAVLLFLWLHAYRRGASPLVSTVLVLLALDAALPRLYLRPEMFAFTLGAALLLLLEGHERTGRRGFLLGSLGVVALWANLHGSVIVGLAAIGLYSVERALRRRREPIVLVEALLFPLAAFAASCLNPEGLRLPMAFRIVSPNFSAYISEWQPLVRGLVIWPIAVLWILSLGTTLLVFRRVSPWRAALVLVLSAVSVRYHRFLTHLIFAMVPLVADNLRLLREQERSSSRAGRAIGGGLLLSGGVLALAFLLFGRGLPGRIGIGAEPGAYPEQACAFARTAKLPGRMLNSYDFGEYLLFCFPGQQVFIDQRAWSAYPDALYGRYLEAMGSVEGVRKLADDYDVSWAFLTRTDPLAEQMAFDPDVWQLLYFDDQALIYARADRGEATGRLHGAFRFINPLNLPMLLNAPAAAGPRIRAELDQQHERCPGCWQYQLVRGAFALAIRDFAEFDRAVAAVTPADRERREMVFLRARHAMATQRYTLAAALYKHLRKVGRNPLGAAALEAEAHAKRGDRAAAKAVINAIAAMPDGEPMALQLRIQLLGEAPPPSPRFEPPQMAPPL